MKYGRRILADVEGYTPGEQPDDPSVIKLNTNENPFPPSPRVIDAIRSVTPDALRRYPDPVSRRLRKTFAERYGYPDENWVIAGNGMDEILALTVRSFCDPGDTLVTTYPTYTLYETLAQLHGATISCVELDAKWQLPEALFAAQGRILFLPRPHAPSGSLFPRAEVERLCDAFPGIVFIDEAYVDFADDNCIDFPKRFENAIVGRTFSKSFSLAGLRVGFAVARPELIREFIKTKDSYNLNAVTQAAATAALEDLGEVEAHRGTICANRAALTEGLRALGFTVPDSQSNFVLAEWSGSPSTRTLFEQLRERRIFVRYFDAPRLDGAMRITVGSAEEIQALLSALRSLIAG